PVRQSRPRRRLITVAACAPIALFVYNRPEHTRQTLEALARNRLAADSPLYVFADGPKPDATTAQREAIAATRELVGSRAWTRRTTVFASPSNRGLADSIVDGVRRVLGAHDRVIVLEDDIVTSPGCLEFFNRS